MKEDIKTFNQLYQEYHPRFVRFANTYVRDTLLSEDISIEAIMYYWEHKHALVAESNIPAYILGIVKHKCLNHLRHIQVEEAHIKSMQEYHEWELNLRISTLQACEPHELFTAEMQEIVQSTLAKLPQQTHRIFKMSRYENKSHKEIAEQLHITTKGVEFHVSKALKALRANLKDYFPLFLYFLTHHH